MPSCPPTSVALIAAVAEANRSRSSNGHPQASAAA
jgi:hypothetical protein